MPLFFFAGSRGRQSDGGKAAVYGAVVVDVSCQNRRAGKIRGHPDEFDLEAFFSVIAVVFRGVKRQVGDGPITGLY